MEYFVICAVALLVSALTLFSGFGLGTLLMPAFALFFPIKLAIAATAVVHLANNLFKLFLVGRHADMKTVFRFTIPAILFASLGAFLLEYLSGVPVLISYQIGAMSCEITLVKLVTAILIMFFSFWDLSPRLERLEFGPKYVPLGGALSGLFGGLSGLQGALRSAFLIRCGLSRDAFIGTGVVSTVGVDTARLIVYGATFVNHDFSSLAGHGAMGTILAGTIAAFVGSFIGNRMLKKVTMRTVQLIVGVMLILLSVALGTGIV